MRVTVLASGSKANATLIDNGKSVILIDVGIAKRELINKLHICGYDLKDIDAVLVSHEHQDHIKSIGLFPKEKIYSGEQTFEAIKNNILYPNEKVNIKSYKITPIPLSHDSLNCLGFVIETNNKKISYILDTGYLSKKQKEKIKNSHLYIIESNYDVEMLLESKRPTYLKSRILSDVGHLSNEESCQILKEVIGVNTKQIIFAHLSKEVNNNKKVLETYKEYFPNNNNIKVVISDQKEMVEGEI